MTLLARSSGIELSTPALGDVFTTDARPLAQPIPPISIVAGGGSGPLPSGIVFPDLDKSYGYQYFSGTQVVAGQNIPYDACTTYGRLLPQEWGPPALGYAAPHQLPDIDLGAAPSWADFLEMSVNLLQSTRPDFSSAVDGSNMLSATWPCEISQGGWMDCEDGCCPVEAMAGLARQFWVEIVAGRIVLRRQQSITGVLIIPSGTSGLPNQYGLLTHLIDGKTGNGSNSNVGGSNQCSITNSVNYQTAYTGQLLITPVNYQGP